MCLPAHRLFVSSSNKFYLIESAKAILRHLSAAEPEMAPLLNQMPWVEAGNHLIPPKPGAGKFLRWGSLKRT